LRIADWPLKYGENGDTTTLNERYSPRDNDISGKTEWLNNLTVTLVFNQTSLFLIDQILFTQVRYRYNNKPLKTEPQTLYWQRKFRHKKTGDYY